MTTTVEYTRTQGRCLVYRIEADDWGRFTIFLGSQQVMHGRDPLVANGYRRQPNKRKAAGAIHIAKQAIESLREMGEF